MHGEVTIGVGLYIFYAIYVLVGLLGVWMMVDTMRAKRREQRKLVHIPSEPLTIYALLGGLYFILMLLQFLFVLLDISQAFGMIMIPAIPIMVVVEIAYLLRVVFPKAPKELKEPKGTKGSKEQKRSKGSKGLKSSVAPKTPNKPKRAER